jgi:hypothetical protein
LRLGNLLQDVLNDNSVIHPDIPIIQSALKRWMIWKALRWGQLDVVVRLDDVDI